MSKKSLARKGEKFENSIFKIGFRCKIQVIVDLLGMLRKNNLDDMCVICGGTIPKHQVEELKKKGVSEVFLPQSTSESIVNYIVSRF